jgi:hypothetical protein
MLKREEQRKLARTKFESYCGVGELISQLLKFNFSPVGFVEIAKLRICITVTRLDNVIYLHFLYSFLFQGNLLFVQYLHFRCISTISSVEMCWLAYVLFQT